jgi:hypothetical protein
MAHLQHRVALAALVAAGVAAPAWADPASSASSASSAGSQSSASISNSIQGSSNSSSGETKVAEGEYRIIEVAEVAEQPGTQRLKLQALKAAGGELALVDHLLRQVQVELVVGRAGGTVLAKHKPYGLEFAHGKTLKGFFMALKDEWYRELQTRPVSL